MKINGSTSTEATLQVIGKRLLEQRLGAKLTQARLAQKAGVSKRTIERIESGSSVQLSTLIQVLRVFNLLEVFKTVFPEKSVSPRPAVATPAENNISASRATRNRWFWESKK